MAEKADVLEYRMRMFKGVGERFLNGFPSFIDNVRCANIIPVKNGSNAFFESKGRTVARVSNVSDEGV